MSIYSGDFPVFVHGLVEMLVDWALGFSKDENVSAFGEQSMFDCLEGAVGPSGEEVPDAIKGVD